MHTKDILNFLTALDAALEAVPGLVDEKHIRNLQKLRGIFALVQQIREVK